MYTVKPNGKDAEVLKDLDCSFSQDRKDYSQIVIEKPWGREKQVKLTEQFSIWRMELNPESETSMHCHTGKDTILIVLEGEVDFSTLDDVVHLKVGDQVEIEKRAFHKTSTKTGAVVIEVESPPNKHDLIRFSDKYGREGQAY